MNTPLLTWAAIEKQSFADWYFNDRVADFPDIGFSNFANAASVRSCSGLVSAVRHDFRLQSFIRVQSG